MKPWLIRKEEKPLAEGEYLQTPEQLDRYKQFSMCINCMLCYAACPVVGLDPMFVGPAAMALAQRYNLDSRDQGAAERIDILSQHDGIWGCTFVGECTRVCPKHVDPAGAIQQYKFAAVMSWLKSFVMPRGRRHNLMPTSTLEPQKKSTGYKPFHPRWYRPVSRCIGGWADGII